MADQGRPVFLSSHLLSEMELTADHLIVIGGGRLIADTDIQQFIEHNSEASTVVRSPQPEKLRAVLHDRGADVASARTAPGGSAASTPQLSVTWQTLTTSRCTN